MELCELSGWPQMIRVAWDLQDSGVGAGGGGEQETQN